MFLTKNDQGYVAFFYFSFMLKRTGVADLPLHTGTVPRWLADRMRDLGRLIAESIVENYGKKEFLVRLSDPLWFQSFGAVLGMDWHSSGITTSVMYALKRALNPIANEFGIYVCGGRGKFSRGLFYAAAVDFSWFLAVTTHGYAIVDLSARK